jgi:hypothetical protein
MQNLIDMQSKPLARCNTTAWQADSTYASLGDDCTAAVDELGDFKDSDNSTWASHWVSERQVMTLAGRGSSTSKDAIRKFQSWVVGSPSDMEAAYGVHLYKQDTALTHLIEPRNTLDADSDAWRVAVLESACKVYKVEMRQPKLSLTLQPSNRVECAPNGADVYVFVRNCFLPEVVTDKNGKSSSTDPGLMVRVKLDMMNATTTSKYNMCYKVPDNVLLYLNYSALVFAALALMLLFVAFEVVPSPWHLAQRRWSDLAW